MHTLPFNTVSQRDHWILAPHSMYQGQDRSTEMPIAQ